MSMEKTTINGQEKVKADSTYNVLIFALSIFNKYLKEERSFQYIAETDHSIIIEGKYQLEPIPHYLIKHGKELKNPISSIDEVIMLCTPQTENDMQPHGLFEQKTPLEYIKSKIDNWSTQSVKFKPIEVNVNELKKAVDETVEYLRTLRKDEKNVRIIMDCHGGFRSTQLVIEAIISLLRIEGFVVSSEDIWTVYDDNNNNYYIAQDSEAFEIFDFVAGINEFVNYGRSDSLRRFVNDDKDPLLNLLEYIANGIQMCLIQEFETGLTRLTNYFNPNKGEKHTKHPYLSLFEDMIRDNFGGLLSDSRTVEDEIQWCFDKGFYQQALTIIEARGPRSLHDQGVIKYDYGVWRYAKSLDAPNRYETVNRIIKTIFPTGSYEEFLKESPVNKQIKWAFTESWFTANVLCSEKAQRWVGSYCRIANYRNNANHAGSNDFKTEDIKKEIQNYLSISRELIEASQKPQLEISAKDFAAMLYIIDLLPNTDDSNAEPVDGNIFKKLRTGLNENDKSCELNRQLEAFLSESEEIYNNRNTGRFQNIVKCQSRLPITLKLYNKGYKKKDQNENSDWTTYVSRSKKYEAGIKTLMFAKDKNSTKALVDVLKERASINLPPTYIFKSILKLVQKKGMLISPLPDLPENPLLNGLQEFLNEYHEVMKSFDDNEQTYNEKFINAFFKRTPILSSFCFKLDPDKADDNGVSYFKTTFCDKEEKTSDLLIEECCKNMKTLKKAIKSCRNQEEANE